MIFTQTSNQALEFRDYNRASINILLQTREIAETQEAKENFNPRVKVYDYLSYLHQGAEFSSLSTLALLSHAWSEATKSLSDLEKLKALKLAIINHTYEAKATELLLASTPASEIASWHKQESEANAYKQNNQAPTPYIDTLAHTRGVEKEQLVEKILAKAQAYTTASATLTGARQKLEDQITKAKSKAALEKIHFN